MKTKVYTSTQSLDFEMPQTPDVFQSLDMFRFYEGLPRHYPLLFVVHSKVDNRILGSLLAVYIRGDKGIFSFMKRCLVLGTPPIFSVEQPTEISETLLNVFFLHVRKQSFAIEFRHLSCWHPIYAILEKCGFAKVPWMNVKNTLTTKDILWENLSSSKRTQINQSLKNGASITAVKDEEQVIEVYRLFRHLYKKIKRPLPPYEFFLDFYTEACQKGWGQMFVVEFQGTVIGGILCPITVGETLYEWYIVGEDRRYQGIHPSVLATWAALEYAATHSIPVFDFMGAGRVGASYGVRNFKLKFGGELVEAPRFIRFNSVFARLAFRWMKNT